MSPAFISLQLERCGFALLILLAFCLPLSTSFVAVLFATSAGLALITPSLRRRLPAVLSQPIVLALLGLVVLMALGMTYSVADWSERLLLLKKYSKYATVVLLFPYFTNDKRQRWCVSAYLAGCVVMLTVAYVKFFGHYHWWPTLQPAAAFKDHIQMSFLFSLAIAICIYRRRWGYLLIAGLMTYHLIFMSPSRTGYVLLPMLMLGMLVYYWRWRGLLAGLVMVAVMLAGAYQFSATFRHRIDYSRQTYWAQSTSVDHTNHRYPPMRLRYAKNALHMIRQHPWLGSGTGSFGPVYRQFEHDPFYFISNPHNEYLNLWQQLGLPGLMIFLAILAIAWIESENSAPEARFLLRALVAIIAVGSMANSWLMDTTEGHAFAFFLALAFGSHSSARVWFTRRQRSPLTLTPASD